MRAAATTKEFLADPVGSYFAGRAFVVWASNRTRVGMSYFGAFDEDDRATLTELFELAISPALESGVDAVVDVSAISVLDRSAFQLAVSFFEGRARDLCERGRRFALVRPSGMSGAAFTGLFLDFFRPPLEAGLFNNLGDAMSWFGVPEGSAERQDVECLIAELARSGPMLRRLREVISADVKLASVDRAAAALGESVRSLQRQLAANGTSFRAELNRAQALAARALLLETNEKIEVVARRLGFRSVSAFISMFERLVGESPSAFRQRQRAD